MHQLLPEGAFAVPIVFLFIGLALLLFWGWMLIDAINNKSLTDNLRLIWVLVIVFAGPIGAFIYLIGGRSA